VTGIERRWIYLEIPAKPKFKTQFFIWKKYWQLTAAFKFDYPIFAVRLKKPAGQV